MTSYAAQTTVDTGRSREEIERTLTRFRATQVAWMRDDETGRVIVAFKRDGKTYKFVLQMPTLTDRMIQYTPKQMILRTDAQRRDALEQERRRRFRSLANLLKATLDAIDTGIISEEAALLSNLILPNGSTVQEFLLPQIDRMLEAGEMPDLRHALTAGEDRR